MSDNRSMPRSTIIPVLGYNDVLEAIDWLTRVFGFTERLRVAEHRAQLTYGLGDLVVTKSAATGNMASHSIMVRVADVDAHYQHVKEAGARIVGEPTTFHTVSVNIRPWILAAMSGHSRGDAALVRPMKARPAK